ncbi:hypothetical protein HN358_01700 [Candidatus Uhrbacteria bacterium]|jgi:hypothetical protein|nr:hypothetical protein [Candidatus Uhrbacteria bacterium]MBT7717751.1 hypothetical protein [Candidatus Uhrbacteria bacterium]
MTTRKPAHEALLDHLNHLVAQGGLAEPEKGGQMQYREFYALSGLKNRVNSVAIPNGNGEAREIAQQINQRLSKLYELAIDPGVGEEITAMIEGLTSDYLVSEPVAIIPPRSSAENIGMSDI